MRPVDVRDEVIYRCVNVVCARALPRRVNYCPYCGIDQSTALPRPLPSSLPLPPQLQQPLGAGAQRHGFGVDAVPAARAHTASVAVVADAPAPPAPPSASASPSAIKAAPPTPAVPPRRQPVRLRWWLLALGTLVLLWFSQRPTPAKFDARVDQAVALAQACKANDAQAELIALKKTAASAAQLARLQTALDDADLACRRPARARAPAKSSARAAGPQAQSVRNLIGDARAAVARGDYRGAADKMEVCIAMVDASTRDCSELKARAERLDGELRRCLANGGEWVGARCQ